MIRAEEALVKVEFVLQDAVNPFGHSILVAVVLLGHADPDVVFLQLLHVLVAAVLYAPIGVVYQAGRWAGCLLSSFEGSKAARQLQRVAEVVPHNSTGEQVGDKRKVAKPVHRSDVGNIGHPNLVGRSNRHALHQILVLVESVVRVGRSARRPLAPNKQIVLLEDPEQPVAAYL